MRALVISVLVLVGAVRVATAEPPAAPAAAPAPAPAAGPTAPASAGEPTATAPAAGEPTATAPAAGPTAPTATPTAPAPPAPAAAPPALPPDLPTHGRVGGVALDPADLPITDLDKEGGRRKPSGFWTGVRPARGSPYRWPLVITALITVAVTLLLLWRFLRRPRAATSTS